MPDDTLKRELTAELACMRQVVEQIEAIRAGVVERGRPDVRDTAAAALFLSQFYMGVENVLKRICRSRGVALPTGRNWHVALLDRFRAGAAGGCPALVSEELYADLDMYRCYRHVVVHSYAFMLVWEKLTPGLDATRVSLDRFERAVHSYLDQDDAIGPACVREPAPAYGVSRAPVYLTQAETAALADIKQRVSALFPVRDFILYGSKARGDFGPDSDVDLLIVTRRPLSREEKHTVSHELTAANRRHGTLFSFVAVDAQQWDSGLLSVHGLRRTVAEEGVAV